MHLAPDSLLWQLADSAFPAGGFAHSAGLEAAWQAGQVADRNALAEFLIASVTATARGVAPFVAASCNEPSRVPDFDAACDLFLNNHVANRASRAQGQAFLRVAHEIFGGSALDHLRERLRRDRLPGHFAPLFGACAAALQIDPSAASRLFIFMSLRGLISSAVRLGIVGPLDAQGMQHRLSPHVDAWAALSQTTAVDDIAQTAPILDLLQATHDRLYSRLFQS
jgi:urease accessory protein